MPNRKIITIASFLVILISSVIFSLSVFYPYLMQSGMTRSSVNLINAGTVLFFLISSLITSFYLIFRFNFRNLTIIGSLLICFAFIIPGIFPVGTLSLLLLVLLLGSGAGLISVTAFTVIMSWYPYHRGTAAGLYFLSHGFGAVLWVKIAGSWGRLLDNFGLSSTFIIYGLLFFTLAIFCSFAMILPSGTVSIKNREIDFNEIAKSSKKFKDIIKVKDFYLLLLAFILSTGAGFISVSAIRMYSSISLVSSGVAQESAIIITGTAMTVFFTIGNGLGRFIWGYISDIFNRKKIIMILCILQSIAIILTYFFAHSEVILYIVASIIGLNIGGILTLFTALTADTFGITYIAQNIIIIFLFKSIGTGFSPIITGYLMDTGSYLTLFLLAAFFCTMAIIPLYYLKGHQLRFNKE